MRKPFDFSPEPSQCPKTDKDDEDEDYDEIEDDSSDTDGEVSFLSMMRLEAKSRQDQPVEEVKREPLSETQILMQSQETPKIEIMCDETVTTTVNITKNFYYKDETGKRIEIGSKNKVYSTSNVVSRRPTCQDIFKIKGKVASTDVIDQTQSQSQRPRKRKRVLSTQNSSNSSSSESEVEAENEPSWLQSWSSVNFEPGAKSCHRTSPVIVPGSRVFCKYSSAYYPATVMEVEPTALRVIYDDIEMKQKKVLVKKENTLLIAQLASDMVILARKPGASVYLSATIIASHQKLNALDMTQREGQLECALTNGYVVKFTDEDDEYFIRNSDVAIEAQMFEDQNSQPVASYVVKADKSDDPIFQLGNIIDSRKRKKRHSTAEISVLFASVVSSKLETYCKEKGVKIMKEFCTKKWLDEEGSVNVMVLDGPYTHPVVTLAVLWNVQTVKFTGTSLVPVKRNVGFAASFETYLTQLNSALASKTINPQVKEFLCRAKRNDNGFKCFGKSYRHVNFARYLSETALQV